MKWWLLLLVIWVSGWVSAGWVWVLWPSSRLKIAFCDVGQGDAILISRGRTQVLIDGGPDDAVLECLATRLPAADKQLELVIATHPDADHIGGLPAVLQRYQVKSMMLPAVGKSTQLFWDFRAALLEESLLGMKVVWSSQQPTFSLGPGVSLTTWAVAPEIEAPDLLQLTETELSAVFEQQEADIDNYNELSIAVLLQFGTYSALLTGDLEEEGELALLNSGLLTHTTTFKAGHHGSNTSTSAQILQATTPEQVIISCGKNNRYGHPDQATMERIRATTDQIWRTDQQGSIEVETDGERYWIRAESRSGSASEDGKEV